MKKKLVLLSIVLLIAACEKDNIKVDPNNPLLGNWVNYGYEDQNQVLKRSISLEEDKPGFVFCADGTFIERNISGWCATPPVSYSNYRGTFSFVEDDLIHVNVEYWGGMRDYYLSIISLSESEMKVLYLYPDYR